MRNYWSNDTPLIFVSNGARPNRMFEEAFEGDSMSKSQSERWHKIFREGRENVANDTRCGRPATSHGDATVARVRELLNADRRMSVRLLGDTLNISKSVIHRIVTDELQMRKVCAKLVPKVLTGSRLQQFRNCLTVPTLPHRTSFCFRR